MPTTLAGHHAPTTSPSFAQLGLPDGLVASLARRGISHPMPVQEATIPDALAGRDVSAEAPTGSGKTLAFALPLAARVSPGRARRPTGLVLAPTRELASQIAEVMKPLLGVRGLRVQTFFGGTGFGPQRSSLRKGVDVAVACPGRLEDLIRQGEVSLSEVEIVVVDEADRMADMGFMPAVRRLLDSTAADRQTLLYSATLDGDVEALVRRYQRDPVRHETRSGIEAASTVTHRFETVHNGDRVSACAGVVADAGTSIVFVRTKHGVDRLTRQLAHTGVAAAAIHGGRSQPQRERALAAFRSGRVRVLVATDVAARGIHVDAVSRVVHFDLPGDAKDYLHRSGRTARAGADGAVVALVLPEQAAKAAALQRSLNLAGPQPRGQGRARRTPFGGSGGAAKAKRGRGARRRVHPARAVRPA